MSAYHTDTMLIILRKIVLLPNIQYLKLSALAQKHYLSTKTIARNFSACFDIPLSNLAHEQIMKQAIWLLLTTDKTIENISDELGYSTRNNFTQQFKRVYSLTPDALRRLKRATRSNA
ncbi:helix-turn-helix domain-containing protein [Chitinophaga sp. 30R24]|uniref:helix-turn-helix domain-containing protein n=1 Tax=Chitinophaga sp. 30R24 TaxID=3248838 RepID=UPI003B8F5024